jgi:hypothetical protein
MGVTNLRLPGGGPGYRGAGRPDSRNGGLTALHTWEVTADGCRQDRKFTVTCAARDNHPITSPRSKKNAAPNRISNDFAGVYNRTPNC